MFQAFTLDRYCSSGSARRKGISNQPSPDIISHLQELDSLLVKVKSSWRSYCQSHNLSGSQDIILTSGYRSPAVNSSVNGSNKSAHMYGYAADTQPMNRNINAYFQWAKEFAYSGVAFDQIIIETSGSSKWLHIGIRNSSGQQRGQVSSINNGNMTVESVNGSGDSSSSDENQQPAIQTDPTKLMSNGDDGNDIDWDDPSLYNLSMDEISEAEKEDIKNNNSKKASSKKLSAKNLMIYGGASSNNANKRAYFVMDKLMGSPLYLSKAQAAGVCGNLYQESKFGPQQGQIGGGGGYGLAQWTTSDRKAAAQRFLGKPLSQANLNEQTNYLIHELQTNKGYGLAELKRCSSASEACSVFQHKFERAGIPNMGNRIKWANTFDKGYSPGAGNGQGGYMGSGTGGTIDPNASSGYFGSSGSYDSDPPIPPIQVDPTKLISNGDEGNDIDWEDQSLYNQDLAQITDSEDLDSQEWQNIFKSNTPKQNASKNMTVISNEIEPEPREKHQLKTDDESTILQDEKSVTIGNWTDEKAKQTKSKGNETPDFSGLDDQPYGSGAFAI